MIKYMLKCDLGHEFEGWFRDSKDYDQQEKKHLLECPQCGNQNIEKALMAPSIARKGAVSVSSAAEEKMARIREDYNQSARKAKEYVEKNFDNVGDRFPEEARKIHYGETSERNIYGQATGQEVKELHEEGVTVTPIPKPIGARPSEKKKLN